MAAKATQDNAATFHELPALWSPAEVARHGSLPLVRETPQSRGGADVQGLGGAGENAAGGNCATGNQLHT